MSQNGNIFTAFWMNTATAPGTPLTGLSATINIRDLTGTLVINAQAFFLEGICVMLDYVLATQNPTTDMWLVGVKWTEYTAV